MIQFSLAHPATGTAQYFEEETMPTMQMWVDMASRTTDPLGGFQAILAFLQQPAFRASVCRVHPDDDSDSIPDECTVVALIIAGPKISMPLYVGDATLRAELGGAPRPYFPKQITAHVGLNRGGQLSWYSNCDCADSTLCIRQTSSDPVALPAFLTGTIHLSSFFPEVASLHVAPLPLRPPLQLGLAPHYSHTVCIPLPPSERSCDTNPSHFNLRLRVTHGHYASNPLQVHAVFSVADPVEVVDSFTLNWSAEFASLSRLTEGLFLLISNALIAYAQFRMLRDLCNSFATALAPLPHNLLCWNLFGSERHRFSWTLFDPHDNYAPVPLDIRRDGPVNPQTLALRMAIDLPLCAEIDPPQETPRLTLLKAPTGITTLIYFPPPTVVFPAGESNQFTPEFVSVYNYLHAVLCSKTAASLQC